MTTMGCNNIYQLGYSTGEKLYNDDPDLDFKEMHAQVQEIREQLGEGEMVGKLMDSDEFLGGVQNGYVMSYHLAHGTDLHMQGGLTIIDETT